MLWYAIALQEDLCSLDEYEQVLNDLFLKNPISDFLLDLVYCLSDKRKTIYIIRSYYADHIEELDKNLVGKHLIKMCEKLYFSGKYEVDDFAGRLYDLWEGLPPYLQDEELFHTLSYGDEPLSWSDIDLIYKSLWKYYD